MLPPADVDEQQPLVEHGDRLQHAEVDEAGLLEAGDDLDPDAGLGAGPAEEDVPVLGLPDRAGGHGPHAWRRAPRRSAGWRTERGDAPVDGVVLETASCRPPPEPSRTMSFSRASTSKRSDADGPGHHQVERVGADVDGREGRRVAHAGARSMRPRRPRSTAAP